MMKQKDPILSRIDKLIRISRLKEIEFIMSTDVNQRLHEIGGALKRLPRGDYLLGTGPSTVGIVPLDTREVVLGRPPTILEPPSEAAADYCAADTLYFVPREVSRTHAKVMRELAESGCTHTVIDLNSTCGTFVNGVSVGLDDGVVLQHGDVVSLGPSQTSTYIYYRAGRVVPQAEEETNRSSMSWVWFPEQE